MGSLLGLRYTAAVRQQGLNGGRSFGEDRPGPNNTSIPGTAASTTDLQLLNLAVGKLVQVLPASVAGVRFGNLLNPTKRTKAAHYLLLAGPIGACKRCTICESKGGGVMESLRVA